MCICNFLASKYSNVPKTATLHTSQSDSERANALSLFRSAAKSRSAWLKLSAPLSSDAAAAQPTAKEEDKTINGDGPQAKDVKKTDRSTARHSIFPLVRRIYTARLSFRLITRTARLCRHCWRTPRPTIAAAAAADNRAERSLRATFSVCLAHMYSVFCLCFVARLSRSRSDGRMH